MNLLVVSPHFDDGVLSCWSLVAGDDDVTVLTVFTEGPEPGFVADWDSDTGVDSATRMRQRAAENRAALALAGREPVDLGLKEAIYGGDGCDPRALRPLVEKADVVYVPAGVGVEHVNREHVLVRDACLEVRDDCRLYADQPYSLFRNDIEPPSDLTGVRSRRVVSLSVEERLTKARAIACYAGEVAKLERSFGAITQPARLAYELFWD